MNSLQTIAGETVYTKGFYPEMFFIVYSGAVIVEANIVLVDKC